MSRARGMGEEEEEGGRESTNRNAQVWAWSLPFQRRASLGWMNVFFSHVSCPFVRGVSIAVRF